MMNGEAVRANIILNVLLPLIPAALLKGSS